MAADEAHAFTMVNQVHVNRNDVSLKLKILRVWRLPDRRNPKDVYSIEMILTDENGDRIQANVFKRLFFRFERFLKENANIILRNPGIGVNSSKYKFASNPNKLCLNMNTLISDVNVDFQGPDFGFSFVPYQRILDKDVDESVTIDVIGHVSKFFNNDDKDKKAVVGKKRLTMEIQDIEGLNIYVTLWDTYAMEMSKYVATHQTDKQYIIILQFGRLKFYNGKPYVSNSFGDDVTRLLINEDIEDINNYKLSLFKKISENPSSSYRPYGTSMFCSDEDEFLHNTPFSNIGDICEIQEEQPLVLLGTIKDLFTELGWHYMGCPKCTKKCGIDYVIKPLGEGSSQFEEEKVFQCVNENCSAKEVVPTPRFKIQVRVQDLNGAVSLTLFHRDAAQLLNKSATDLLEENTVGDTVQYPEEIKALLEKELAFKIFVSVFNLNNKYDVYGVTKITDDPTIISELKKKCYVGQPTESESVHTSMLAMPSNDMSVTKESKSDTGDNETPISVADNFVEKKVYVEGEQCSINKKYHMVKRKLIVYDSDDESIPISSTKIGGGGVRDKDKME